MEGLPSETALDILSRLPINSLVQIKCVCKAWRALAEDPRLRHSFHARESERNPCLLIYCDSSSHDQGKLFSVIAGAGTDDYNSKVLRIDSRLKCLMPRYHLSSCNGLLCVSDSLYFDIYNPFTGNHIELPKASRSLAGEVTHGFGYHPTTKEYKVVQIVESDENVQVFTLGTSGWRSGGRPPRRLYWGSSEALFNGALHWVSAPQSLSSRRIVSFNLAEEEFRLIPSPICGSLDSCDFNLVVLGGCLSAVVNQDDGQIDIWVMKEYNVKESWTKDIVIGAKNPVQIKRMKGSRRVLCILKNGDVLLEYDSGSFVTYNPETEELKELVIPGLPGWFYAIVHVESLFPVEAILQIKGKRNKRQFRL